MKWLLFAVLLTSCSKSSPAKGDLPPPAPAPTVIDESTPTSAAEAAASDAGTGLTPYPEAWDPRVPVDLKTLKTHNMYVTVATSAICPTRKEAEARDCGNSVESSNLGLRLTEGESVVVVGDAPFDGHWRAIRFQKAGTLPSWIAAADVSDKAKATALSLFDAREEVAKALAVDDMSGEEIRKLKAGTLVKWTRHTKIRLAGYGGLTKADKDYGVLMYVPTKGGKPVVVKLFEKEDSPDFEMSHDCLKNGDCLQLDYTCNKAGECDEVSILARTRKSRSKGPSKEDDEYGVWPKAWKGYFMPSLDGVLIADRFGLREFVLR